MPGRLAETHSVKCICLNVSLMSAVQLLIAQPSAPSVAKSWRIFSGATCFSSPIWRRRPARFTRAFFHGFRKIRWFSLCISSPSRSAVWKSKTVHSTDAPRVTTEFLEGMKWRGLWRRGTSSARFKLQ